LPPFCCFAEPGDPIALGRVTYRCDLDLRLPSAFCPRTPFLGRTLMCSTRTIPVSICILFQFLSEIRPKSSNRKRVIHFVNCHDGTVKSSTARTGAMSSINLGSPIDPSRHPGQGCDGCLRRMLIRRAAVRADRDGIGRDLPDLCTAFCATRWHDGGQGRGPSSSKVRDLWDDGDTAELANSSSWLTGGLRTNTKKYRYSVNSYSA
jgi:hypothetical protein